MQILLATLALIAVALGSSHSEAPGALEKPQLDWTDLYAFRSYEPSRVNGKWLTIIANANPLQDRYAGPNYKPLNTNAFYDIYIDQDGDGVEDITFTFLFGETGKGFTVPVHGRNISIPLQFRGQVTAGDNGNSNLNRIETYQVKMFTGPNKEYKYFEQGIDVTNVATGKNRFIKPSDYAGEKTFPDYAAYADQYKYDASFSCSGTNGRMFVGPRRESFAVNLGKIFDLVNLVPVDNSAGLGAGIDQSDCNNVIRQKSITTFALELPLNCFNSEVIGIWAGVRQLIHKNNQHGFGYQVNRIGMPLFNEVIVGLADKDIYSVSYPKDDNAHFRKYLNYPTLPVILDSLFLGAVQGLLNDSNLATIIPTFYPRNDLVDVFFRGIPGVNRHPNIQRSAEMLRINTTTAPILRGDQSGLGLLAGDGSGFPNGRRPGNDVVDIELRVLMGVLCGDSSAYCSSSEAAFRNVPWTDGAPQRADQFDNSWPYLVTPFAGNLLPSELPSCQ